MSYLNNFNVEKIDSIPEVKQQLRTLKKAIENKELCGYTPPSTGIPKTDLSQEVRNSLLKADNSVPTAISTTWSELKALRDNSQLIPGCWYRITDYECTTAQENTKSAGHKFDVLVLATSVNTLSEEARAVQSERDYEGAYVDDGDHCVYTGRKITVHFEDVTKELYFWHTEGANPYNGYYSELSLEELKLLTQEQLNETLWVWIDNDTVISENEISTSYIYDDEVTTLAELSLTYSFDSYFSKCNLNAWKIWYCLDNDTSRFAWACDGLYPAYISKGEILDGEHLEFQGVKNLNGSFELFYGTPEQSMRYCDDADANMGWVLRNAGDDESLAYTNRNTWTEALDDDNISIVLIYDNGFDEAFTIHSEDLSSESVIVGKGVIYRMIDEWNNDCPYDFKNIQFERFYLSDFTKVPSLNCDDSNNTFNFPYGAYDLTGDKVISDGSYGTMFYVYTFALEDLNSGNYYDYTVEAYRGLKTDDGSELCCYNNVIQPVTHEFQSGNGLCAKMLNNCVFFNVYDDIFNPLTADNYSHCSGIKLGKDCASLTFGRECYDIICKNNCFNFTCGNSCFGFTCGRCCYNIILGNDCHSWTCGNQCHHFTCKEFCIYWTCGNDCNMWSILASNCSYWTCGNSCSGWTIVNNKTKYFNLLSGCGTNLDLSDYLDDNVDYVQYVGKTSNGNIRCWNPADPSGT